MRLDKGDLWLMFVSISHAIRLSKRIKLGTSTRLKSGLRNTEFFWLCSACAPGCTSAGSHKERNRRKQTGA